jgi:hypothetical protein
MSKLRVFRGCHAILNIHERSLPVPAEVAARLLDSLAGANDQLWPREQWPPMVLDHGLAIGSRGGHSLIRYQITEYVAGRRVEFEFEPMRHMMAFRGRHYFEVVERGRRTILRHTIDVDTDFTTWVYWKLFIEHVHDAVLEDAFDKAERNTGMPRPHRSRWSWHVHFLRWLRRRQAARAQAA